jgi:diguanylate cyclase (GGDEF)-like protein/PAS domain S-box-containing protein
MLADESIKASAAVTARQDQAAAGIIADLAEALADVLYVIQLYPEFRFEYVSSSVENVVGYTAEEHYADPGLSERLVDPKDLQEFAMWIVSSPDGPLEFTKVWRAKDGRDVWAQHRCLKQTRADGSVALYGAARDVTAQIEAEHALAASQEMYRLLAENASDVVWRTDTASTVEWVSPSVVSVIGWTPDEMVGRPITDLVHSEDADRVRQAGDVANDGGRVSFEARYRCKDGSYRWLEITARPVVDADGVVVGRVGSCRDVDSEVEAWQALERSEQRFSMAMESAPIGMAVLDLEGRFIEVNAALCRILGHDASWLLAHRMSDVLHPQDSEIDFRMRDSVLTGSAPSMMNEVRLLNRRREVVWVQQAVGLLRDEEDMPLSYVAQFVNVTEAREARETLRFMATHDPLTQLLNRRELLARMSTVLAHSPRGGARMAVLFADLDGLKPANDTYGHSAGDQLIVEAARRIAAQVRDEDLTARIGGDEFIVVLPAVNGLPDALAVAAKIGEAIAEPCYVAGHQVPMHVSIGVALAAAGEDATTVLRHADAALYRAKAAGRQRTEVYDATVDHLTG